MHRININQVQINNNQNVGTTRRLNNTTTSKTSFKDILSNQINNNKDIKFSKHALERLEQRKIQLTSQEMDKLNNAFIKAETKGIKETLIIMDNKAFIASVPNRTIITAATGNQLKENVFTNIDGAIFA